MNIKKVADGAVDEAFRLCPLCPELPLYGAITLILATVILLVIIL